MFKPDLWQSHNEYRTLVNTYGRRLSRSIPKYSFDLYDKERQKLLNLNLDPLLEYIPRFYSETGCPAKNQAQILRSLILFVLFFNKTPAKTSLTAWVKDVLPGSIFLIVLVGCTCAGELPPPGSYYDFMNRFWLASRNSYSRHSLLPKGRNSKKPDKTPGGDGTAVVSHASPYNRHLSSCSKTCLYRDGYARHYSDPDTAWGWDSDNKTWFFGHTLYMLCSRNSSLKIELPLLMKFTGARLHDSKKFLYAIDDFGRHLYGLSPKNVCPDSAHNNIPTYELLDCWDINALIDINGRAKSSPNAPKDITFDKTGHPPLPYRA